MSEADTMTEPFDDEFLAGLGVCWGDGFMAEDEWAQAEWDAGHAAGRHGNGMASGTQQYADGYDAGAWELAAVEDAALADDSAWLGLPQWDALDAFADVPGAEWDARTQQLWVPLTPLAVNWRLDNAGLYDVPTYETAMVAGCRIDIHSLGV